MSDMRLAQVGSVLFATLLLACSSKQGTGGDGANASLDGDKNPDGIAYPTAHLGNQARGLGSQGKPNTTPGNVIPNMTFFGYPNGDSTQALQPISLASFYDPDAKRYKLLHVIFSAGWCTDCQAEIGALKQALADPNLDYRKKGVVYLEALGDGPRVNVAATQHDLDTWMASHPNLFDEVLDPSAANLGALFNVSAVPFNANIDPRTMEILSSGVGYEDPLAIQVWLAWATSNPAARL